MYNKRPSGALIFEINVYNTKAPFAFGINDDGQYGYIKTGADTVTPFNHLVAIGFIDAAYHTGTNPNGNALLLDSDFSLLRSIDSGSSGYLQIRALADKTVTIFAILTERGTGGTQKVYKNGTDLTSQITNEGVTVNLQTGDYLRFYVSAISGGQSGLGFVLL